MGDPGSGLPDGYTDADFAADMLALRSSAAVAQDSSGTRYLTGEKGGRARESLFDEMFGLVGEEMTWFCNQLSGSAKKKMSEAKANDVEARLYDMFCGTGSYVLEGFSDKANAIRAYLTSRELDRLRLSHVAGWFKVRYRDRMDAETRRFTPAPVGDQAATADQALTQHLVATSPFATHPTLPAFSEEANRIDGSRPRKARPNGAEPAGDEAAPVMWDAHAPDKEDNIRMRIEPSDSGRFSLEEIIYSLADEGEDPHERVCLRALEVVWDWRQSRQVTFSSAWNDPTQRLARLKSDNPGVRIASFIRDTALLRVRLEALSNDVALSPADDIAVLRLLMPEATIIPQPQMLHVFRVEARKSDLCLARRDGDGQYRRILLEPDMLRSQATVLDQAIVALYVELREGFPSDNRQTRELGRREAEAIRNLGDAS